MNIYNKIFEEVHSEDETTGVYDVETWKKITTIYSIGIDKKVNPAEIESGISVYDFKESAKNFISNLRNKLVSKEFEETDIRKKMKSAEKTLKNILEIIQKDEFEGVTKIALESQYEYEPEEIKSGRPNPFGDDPDVTITGRPQLEGQQARPFRYR